MCAAKRRVRFTPNSDRQSGHPLMGRMFLWSAKEEVDLHEEAILTTSARGPWDLEGLPFFFASCCSR
jgi:hypothetical protein